MVVIGVPVDKDCRIDVRTAAYCSMESLRPDTKWSYVSSRDAGVGRSTIVYFALKDPEVTHIYFVDYDVVPPNGTLQKLLAHDVSIVAGIYPMLTTELSWSFKVDGEWRLQSELLPDELTEATCVGGSTLLVKREVFEKLESPCFKIVYKEVDDSGKCYDEGEDEYFSRIVREAGFKIMVDPTIICEHFNYRSL